MGRSGDAMVMGRTVSNFPCHYGGDEYHTGGTVGFIDHSFGFSGSWACTERCRKQRRIFNRILWVEMKPPARESIVDDDRDGGNP